MQAEHEELATKLAAAKEEFSAFERRDIKLQVRVACRSCLDGQMIVLCVGVVW